GGGFSHDQKDSAGPYLGDTLAMGGAFLSLYQVTGDREWLTRTTKAADFIARRFSAEGPNQAGFLTCSGSSTGLKISPQIDENVSAARFFNLLGRYTGEERYHKLAEDGMRFLAAPQVARSRTTWVAGIL